MDQELLKIVRCPVTGTSLVEADAATIGSLNEKISEGALVDRAGQLVETKIDAGLVNADRSLLFPIRKGIVIMVADQAMPLHNTQQA